ncbi:WbqC family protein [Leeuwenhoekiella marinoflava]|uniref:WbqC-like protein n=2 Tax=Leeuwenhoekiella marinoflava TaxID=988 RepID=A0A4Q0PPT9_9FLAO|nr:WbqC family protein [Leeuwenhoekiella marinoflava]RXG32521.1 WbqC-like protein [Leeuwenhoekiella marinoflava]SHE68658.1 WbqC-like protein family protein [Leeuwenhoekiella marinoflava DSM 3653]
MNIIINPTYFPDIITTAALIQADNITLEVCDNYQKQSYRNRMYIATANGKLLLNIPIKHTKKEGHKKTAEALIENNFLWQRQHWRSLVIAYRTSPFFEFYEDDLYPIFHKEYNSLLEFNRASIACVLEMLDVDIDLALTQRYIKDYSDKTDLRFLANAKRKDKLKMPAYRQVFEEPNGFISYLTVLDLIFNLGPEAITYLKNLDLNL